MFREKVKSTISVILIFSMVFLFSSELISSATEFDFGNGTSSVKNTFEEGSSVNNTLHQFDSDDNKVNNTLVDNTTTSATEDRLTITNTAYQTGAGYDFSERETYSLKEGETLQLYAIYTYGTGEVSDTDNSGWYVRGAANVTWSSNDKSIAEVNAQGTVTAKKKGNTVIKAETTGTNKQSKEITIRVTDKDGNGTEEGLNTTDEDEIHHTEIETDDGQVNKDDATMSEVKNEKVETKFGRYGEFTKQQVDIDLKNKTIDIELKVKNNAEAPKMVEKEKEGLKDAKIVFLIDNSNSMKENITSDGQTGAVRKNAVLESASKLVDEIFEKGTNVKIGVVSYASKNTEKVGSDKDAKIRTESLVSTKEDVQKAFDEIKDDNDISDSTTDLEAGLDAAEKVLATDTDTNAKKYIVLLTDGVPNKAIGVGPEVWEDGGSHETAFKSAYDENIINPTKAKLTDLKQKGITTYNILINMDSTELNLSTMKGDDGRPITESEYAEKIFGSETSPVAGPVYKITDNDIESTIVNTLFDDLKTTYTVQEKEGEDYELTNIVIKDYFPQNIIDNFDYSVVKKATKGTVSDLDKTNNLITWKIDKLDYGEEATFTYRLSLKDKFSKDILDIDLPTNRDVEIDYIENDKDGEPIHSDKCPVVKLVVPEKPTPTPDNPPKDNQIIPTPTPTPTPTPKPTPAPKTSPKPLPQTGENSVFILVGIVLTTLLGIGFYKKYKNLR